MASLEEAASDLTETISITVRMGSDGAWRRAARVALLLIAGLTASAAPRSPFSAPAPAAAAPSAVSRAMQASDPDSTGLDDEDDGDDEDAPPIPVFEDEKAAPPPPPVSGNVPVMRDSSSILRVSPPDSTAPAETLRYVPPGESIRGVGPLPARPGDEPAPIVKKPKGGLFGVPPIFIILGLTVVHILIVNRVTE